MLPHDQGAPLTGRERAGDKAFYLPATDWVTLPPRSLFESAREFDRDRIVDSDRAPAESLASNDCSGLIETGEL